MYEWGCLCFQQIDKILYRSVFLKHFGGMFIKSSHSRKKHLLYLASMIIFKYINDSVIHCDNHLSNF